MTTFESWGGLERGAQTAKRYASEADSNKGGRITFENLARSVTPEFAFTVDIARGHINREGVPDEIPFELRITAIFRLENGNWEACLSAR